MDTYKTLTEAQAASTKETVEIAEIDHATEGRCFIGTRAAHTYVTKVHASKPIAGIVRFVARHPAKPVQPTALTCARCGQPVDPNAYSQTEWMRFGSGRVRVQAHYCETCHRTLAACGAGEYSALEARRGAGPKERETRQD